VSEGSGASPYKLALERGAALVDLGRERQALSYFEDAAREDPERAEAFCWMALCWHACEDAEQTLHYAQQAIRREPDYEWPHRLEAYGYILAGDDQRAYESALRSARLEPESAEALHTLGVCALRLGRLPEAEELGRRSHRVAPDREFGPLLLALVAESRGRGRQARAFFEEALRIDPRCPSALRGVARYHGATQDHGRSLDLLQMAAREEPDSPRTQAKLREAVVNVALRGSRGARWKSLGATSTLLLAFFGFAAWLVARLGYTDIYVDYEGALPIVALPLAVLVLSPLAVRQVRAALPGSAALLFDTLWERARRRWCRIGLYVGVPYLGISVLHTWHAGDWTWLVAWLGMPLWFAAIGVWLVCLALSVGFFAMCAYDAVFHVGEIWRRFVPPGPGAPAAIGCGLILTALAIEWLFEPTSGFSLLIPAAIMTGFLIATVGLMLHAPARTVIGWALLGFGAAFITEVVADPPAGIALLRVFLIMGLFAPVAAAPFGLRRLSNMRSGAKHVDRLLGTPPEGLGGGDAGAPVFQR